MPYDDGSWYSRPVFFVHDCEDALAFYRRLGFRERWRHEEHGIPVAVQVDRGTTELILNRNPERAGHGRLFLSLDRGEVAACVEAFAREGIETRDAYWGMPVKVVADPAGNDLLFFDDDLAEPGSGET